MKKKKLYLNKKINKKYKIMISISITFIFLISTYFIINDNRKLTFIEKTLKDSILFISRTIILPFQINQDLETRIIKSKQAEIDNLKKELDELKLTLNLDILNSEYESVNATVISRNLGYFYNTIIIDKGSKDGIKLNNAVTTSTGLIGKIIKITKYNSTVKLLTSDEKMPVSVQIKAGDKYVYGILTFFDRKTKYYTIEGISDTNNIEVGNIVSTTGMGDIFPSGILIGEVKEIAKDNFDLEAIIKVKPSFNIDNFNYVTVLKEK